MEKLMKCKDCRYFKRGKPRTDHSHCTNKARLKEKRKLKKDGTISACELFKKPETIEQIRIRVGQPKAHIRQIPFHQYIEYIKQKKYFSYVRYGDGEWKALFRESGRNGRAHGITPEFHRNMLTSLFKNANNFSVFFGMQRNTYRLEGRQEEIDKFLTENKLDIPWVMAETFHHASRDGILFPLIREMKNHHSIVVGPAFLGELRKKIFPDMFFIEVPHTDCYLEKEKIYREIIDTFDDAGEAENIISFSAGPATEVFILELQEEYPDNFYIDTGSLWDIFAGQRTRGYTQDKENYTEEIIKKNLGEVK